MVQPHRILTRDEIRQVVEFAHNKIGEYAQNEYRRRWQLRLAIFRLSACCGLRRKEMAGLNLDDLAVLGPRPVVAVRKSNTKGGVRDVFRQDGTRKSVDTRRARFVPLWWSESTLTDLYAWKALRLSQTQETKDQPLLVKSRTGNRLRDMDVRIQWKLLLTGALGQERAAEIRLHDGRHSYASHALQAGHSLAAVRDALGHSNISTTSIYLHAIDRPDVGDVFA